MQHYLNRIHDPVGFKFLTSLNAAQDGSEGCLFGTTHVVYVHYDALQRYASDLTLLVPTFGNQEPISYGYVFTSAGKRLFCYVIYRRNGSLAYGVVFEVTPFVLMLMARGLYNSQGTVFGIGPEIEVLAPSDGVPLWHKTLMPDSHSFLCVREGVPSTQPWSNAGDGSPEYSMGGPDSVLSGLLGSASGTTSNASIYFELGSPVFPMMRVNGDLALMRLMNDLGGL
jgi:hypothetical protein